MSDLSLKIEKLDDIIDHLNDTKVFKDFDGLLKTADFVDNFVPGYYDNIAVELLRTVYDILKESNSIEDIYLSLPEKINKLLNKVEKLTD